MNELSAISRPFSDPVLIFALVMLIILLAPLAFRKLKIPGIVGLILAGAVVGPGMLGLLERDDTIHLLGTVGLLYLMFMAGLSIDLNRFEKLRERSIGFGFVSFLIPQMGALAIGLYLMDFPLATSLLLGSIVGSHTLLAYPIAERLGIIKNVPVTMALGGTLVTDTASLGILAVVAGAAVEQPGPGYWFGFGTSVLVFVAAVLVVLPRLGRWYFRNVKHENTMDFVFMVTVLFATAFLAGLAGLAPIIGAFLAGLLLNRLVPGSSTLMSRIRFVGNALLIPFFLISVGMLVDVRVMGSLDVWEKILAFTLLVFAGKGAAAWMTNRWFGYSAAEGWVVYGLTVPQSAATLAVTLVGYDLGFFDQTVVNAVVIMILITCLAGPWLVEKYGRIVAIQEEEKPYEPSDAPQRILVPLANPETSDALMDIAFMVRDEKSEEPVYPLTVARDSRDVEAQVARGEKMLSQAVIHAAAAEVPVNPITSVDLNVARGIARTVSERRISNVIIGWNGEVTARRRIFGSILDQLLEDLDEMVMVSKIEKPVNTFERVVVAVPLFGALESGFPESIRSIKLMADQLGAALTVVSTGQREQQVRNIIDKVKPAVDFDCQPLSDWSELPGWLDENSKEGDLFVLISAREGSLSWRPGLDRLPRVIALRYPSLSFITVYPCEAKKALTDQPGRKKSDILQHSRIKTGLKNGSVDKVLAGMIEGDEMFKDVDISRITRDLMENSGGYTPEVMPGVLLYESHTSVVDEQVLFIGVTGQAVPAEQTAHPVSVFLVLLSPKNLSSQEHLQTLNSVVKLIRPGKELDQVRKAGSADDILKLLVKFRERY